MSSQIILLNGDTSEIKENIVCSHSTSLVPLATLTAGAKLNAKIKYPSALSVGRLKLDYGMGTVAHNVTLYVYETWPLPIVKVVTLPITGAGVTYYPSTPGSVVRYLKLLTTDKDPGGTLTLGLEKWTALIAPDGATGLVGVTMDNGSPAKPGNSLVLVNSGAAQATAKGAIKKDDQLISATGGLVQTLPAGKTGVDIIGTASVDAADGTLFAINVDISSI
jgi:hypothetical protein